MGVIFLMSLFWICYGILGLLGIQNIPKRYRNTEHEKAYKRFQGFTWLLLGIPWFVVCLITQNTTISTDKFALILFACSIPSIVFTLLGDIKFRNKLKK